MSLQTLIYEEGKPLVVYLAGQTGLADTDVRKLILRPNASSLTLTSGSWQELGSGYYSFEIDAAEVEEAGVHLLLFVWSGGDAAYYLYRQPHPPRRDFWVPVLLRDTSGAPAVGLTSPPTVAEWSYNGQQGPFTGSFREVLDNGAGRGVYQLLFEASFLSEADNLTLRLEDAVLQPFQHSFDIQQNSLYPIYFSIPEGLRSGVSLTIFHSSSGLVEAQGTTDAEGKWSALLPEGEYKVLKQKAGYVFSHNLEAFVVPPQRSPQLPAIVISGNAGPYTLTEGQQLVVRVNGGEEQLLVFSASEFPPPTSLSNASANFLAALINTHFHSLTAQPLYVGQQEYLLLATDEVGPQASLEILEAPSTFNFPQGVVSGSGGGYKDNFVYLDGEADTPAVPAAGTVRMRVRLQDVVGMPIAGARVVVVPQPSSPVVGGGGLVSNRHVEEKTNRNGEAFFSLLPGSRIDVVVEGVASGRFGLTVPSVDFDLQAALGPHDVFDVQTPIFPTLPKTKL